MKSLGIDIGTTTISTAVVENGAVIDSETWENGCFLPPSLPGERAQDIGAIEETVNRALDAALSRHPDLKRIGVTGQMHGILYVDRRGNATRITISTPIYTYFNGGSLVRIQIFQHFLCHSQKDFFFLF